MLDAIERRAADYFDNDPSQTALDYVACWIEGGRTINDLAEELTLELGYLIHREWPAQQLRKQFGEQAVDRRLADARTLASHSMAEVAISIADAPVETTVDVARAGNRIRARQWAAERWNPAQYGQQKQGNVTVNVNVLHLDMLKAVNAPQPVATIEVASTQLISPGEPPPSP
jgi:hypothetical protein